MGLNWGSESLGIWFEDYTTAHILFSLHLPCLPALVGKTLGICLLTQSHLSCLSTMKSSKPSFNLLLVMYLVRVTRKISYLSINKYKVDIFVLGSKGSTKYELRVFRENVSFQTMDQLFFVAIIPWRTQLSNYFYTNYTVYKGIQIVTRNFFLRGSA